VHPNVTPYIIERRIETVFFPIIVFGYLAMINSSWIYLILAIASAITSSITFHFFVRLYGGVDPTNNTQNIESIFDILPTKSPIRLILLFLFIAPYAILMLFGVPIVLYLNFALDDLVIVGMSLFYIVFVITSQGHRLFTETKERTQTTLSDFE